jgi:hypothetical protein
VRTLMTDPARHQALREKATFAGRDLDGSQEAATLRAVFQHLG